MDCFEGLAVFLENPEHDVVGMERFLQALESRKEGVEVFGFHLLNEEVERRREVVVRNDRDLTANQFLRSYGL